MEGIGKIDQLILWFQYYFSNMAAEALGEDFANIQVIAGDELNFLQDWCFQKPGSISLMQPSTVDPDLQSHSFSIIL
jgi:hypothetical protein